MPANSKIDSVLAAIKQQKIPILGVKIANKVILPGTFIAKGDAQAAPKVSFEAADKDGKYILICLDPDAPHPAASFLLSPILHWFQSGLQAAADGSKNLVATDTAMAGYRPPNPPGFSPVHRYVFLLYEQPKDFDIKTNLPKDGDEMGLWPRLRYDVDKLVEEMGLGEVVAANYFTSS